MMHTTDDGARSRAVSPLIAASLHVDALPPLGSRGIFCASSALSTGAGGHMTLGIIRRGVVRLVPHDPAWSAEFRRERVRIATAIGERAIAIEHVGSTAIPGIHAKPVLDILVAIADLREANALEPAMQLLGYDFPGDIGIVGERLFGRGPEILTHLVHVVQACGPKWSEYLRFRDSLRADPDLAVQYDEVKRALARQYPDERAKYTEAKGKFIQSVVHGRRGAEPV
jgi:GrpB-like predicted nucleotidyltransferase (UPF0157 family)